MATVKPFYSENEENPGLKLDHFNTLDGKKLTKEPEVIKNSLAEYFASYYQEEISYSIGVIEQEVTNVDDLTKHEGKSLQFSSGDRFFFSSKDNIRDQIFPNPSDGAAYGSNVFTECNKFHRVSGAIVLVIDDKEIDPETGEISGENGGEIPIEIAKKLVQDCYGKIDKALHHQLGNDLDSEGNKREDINTPFQFRLGTNPQIGDEVHRLAKGTLAPRNIKEITLGKHYDLILPKSAFKGRKGETEIQPGVHHWNFGLGNKTEAYRNEQSLGAQALGFYPKGVAADVQPLVEKKARALTEMRGDPRKIAMAYVASEEKRIEFAKENDQENNNNDFDQSSTKELREFTQILKNDSENYSQLLEHPKIAEKLNEYTQKEYKELAMGRAFKFNGSLLQPHPDLKPGEICDPKTEDGKELITLRSPVLNSNGISVFTNRHLEDEEAMKDQGVIFMNPKDAASILQGDFDGDRVAHEKAEKYPTLSDEIKERRKPENRYEEIEKKEKVPYTGSFEEIALAQSQDQIGLIANQVMKAEALRIECESCPDEKKRAFFNEQHRAFAQVLEILEIEPSAVVSKDKHGAKMLKAMTKVVDSDPEKLTDEGIKKGLLLIGREIHASNVSLMGNQLQIAVDGPKSSARPEQEIVNFSRSYLSPLKVNWLDDRKSKETYSQREMKSNRHGPIDTLVQTVNEQYQSSELEKRKSYEFQTLFNNVEFGPEHSKKALELNDEFNQINGYAVKLKQEINEHNSSVQIGLTGKSGKTLYTDRIGQTCNFPKIREKEGEEIEIMLFAPSSTNNQKQWTVIGREKESQNHPQRIGFVTPRSEAELKEILPKLKSHYTRVSLKLESQTTQSQVDAAFKNINSWIEEKREEIKDPVEHQKVAAALWNHNNKRQGEENGQAKGYREYNKATASFRIFASEIAEQVKEQRFTKLTVSTKEESQQEKAKAFIKEGKPVPLTIKKAEDYYFVSLNQDDDFEIGVLVQESPKLPPGSIVEGIFTATPPSTLNAKTFDGIELKIGRLKKGDFANKSWDLNGENLSVTIQPYQETKYRNGKSQTHVGLYSGDKFLGILEEKENQEGLKKLRNHRSSNLKGVTLNLTVTPNSSNKVAELTIDPSTLVLPESWQNPPNPTKNPLHLYLATASQGNHQKRNSAFAITGEVNNSPIAIGEKVDNKSLKALSIIATTKAIELGNQQNTAITIHTNDYNLPSQLPLIQSWKENDWKDENNKPIFNQPLWDELNTTFQNSTQPINFEFEANPRKETAEMAQSLSNNETVKIKNAITSSAQEAQNIQSTHQKQESKTEKLEQDRANQSGKPLEPSNLEDSIQVVNRRTEKEDIYIGRGSPLGNPFPVNHSQDRNQVINSNKLYLYLVVKGQDPLLAAKKVADRHKVSISEEWKKNSPSRDSVFSSLLKIEDQGNQGGCKLGCFCKPQGCHGDNIKALLQSEFWHNTSSHLSPETKTKSNAQDSSNQLEQRTLLSPSGKELKVHIQPETESNCQKWQITRDNELRDRTNNQIIGKVDDSEIQALDQLRKKVNNNTLNIQGKILPPEKTEKLEQRTLLSPSGKELKVHIQPESESNCQKWQITRDNELRDRTNDQIIGKVDDSEIKALDQLRKKVNNQTLNIQGKILPTQPQTLEIYCDGACSGDRGPGGWGIAVTSDGGTTFIAEDNGGKDQTTNNEQELMGAIAAVKKANELGKPTTIKSDSNYVVKGVNEWMNNWKERGWKGSNNQPIKNLELWKQLDTELSNSTVLLTFEKVKGHSNNLGNDRADQLAREYQLSKHTRKRQPAQMEA